MIRTMLKSATGKKVLPVNSRQAVKIKQATTVTTGWLRGRIRG